MQRAPDPKVPRGDGTGQGGTIAARPAASGMPSTIGHGTFTVFAIKVSPVKISNGPGETLLMDEIKQAVAAAGYSVVDAASPGGAPILEAAVKRFDFKNYTWLFPIVPTWGGIDLDLTLVDHGGRVLWQHGYSGSSTNFYYSFDAAVNAALGRILAQIEHDVADPAFHQACCGGGVAVDAAGAARVGRAR
jgi:hypothetical protein